MIVEEVPLIAGRKLLIPDPTLPLASSERGDGSRSWRSGQESSLSCQRQEREFEGKGFRGEGEV
jgi:hypothetical protein